MDGRVYGQRKSREIMSPKNRNLWILIVLSVLVLAGSAALAGAFASSPNEPPPPALLALYLGLRATIFIGVAYAAMRFADRRRFQALAIVGFLGFIDQVVIKAVIVLREMGAHPAEWADISRETVLYGLATSYVYFLPMVLVMGFVGTFLATDRGAAAAKQL
jgi:hypothetical protein